MQDQSLAEVDREVGSSSHTSGRQTRKRKNAAIIYDCICGEVVSQDDIQRRNGVIECRRPGCETRWVSARSFLCKHAD